MGACVAKKIWGICGLGCSHVWFSTAGRHGTVLPRQRLALNWILRTRIRELPSLEPPTTVRPYDALSHNDLPPTLLARTLLLACRRWLGVV